MATGVAALPGHALQLACCPWPCGPWAGGAVFRDGGGCPFDGLAPAPSPGGGRARCASLPVVACGARPVVGWRRWGLAPRSPGWWQTGRMVWLEGLWGLTVVSEGHRVCVVGTPRVWRLAMLWIGLSSSIIVGGSAWILEEWRREDRRRRRNRQMAVRRARVLRELEGGEV